MVDYDETQAIGSRYRRQDEIGTPLCVTVDFDSLDDRPSRSATATPPSRCGCRSTRCVGELSRPARLLTAAAVLGFASPSTTPQVAVIATHRRPSPASVTPLVQAHSQGRRSTPSRARRARCATSSTPTTKDENAVWFYELYTDQAALDAHGSSETMKALGPDDRPVRQRHVRAALPHARSAARGSDGSRDDGDLPRPHPRPPSRGGGGRRPAARPSCALPLDDLPPARGFAAALRLGRRPASWR